VGGVRGLGQCIYICTKNLVYICGSVISSIWLSPCPFVCVGGVRGPRQENIDDVARRDDKGLRHSVGGAVEETAYQCRHFCRHLQRAGAGPRPNLRYGILRSLFQILGKARRSTRFCNRDHNFVACAVGNNGGRWMSKRCLDVVCRGVEQAHEEAEREERRLVPGTVVFFYQKY
jgi:hypothetical protein